MTELYLPQLVDWKIGTVDIEENKVNFELVLGVLCVDCVMTGEFKKDTVGISPDGDPQKEIDTDIEFMQIEINTPVDVDRTDIDLADGQRLKLTEKQVYDLNEILEEMYVIV